MIELEVFGVDLAPGAPGQAELERLCVMVASNLGVRGGHVAIEFVDGRRIAELNLAHRARPQPTDVLSFPIDGVAASEGPEGPGAGAPSSPEEWPANGLPPRELGDIVICPEYTADLREAVVHGMLHLLGMDHETDDGEMLALQDELLGSLRR
jgi:probable rRNA maturation factor